MRCSSSPAAQDRCHTAACESQSFGVWADGFIRSDKLGSPVYPTSYITFGVMNKGITLIHRVGRWIVAVAHWIADAWRVWGALAVAMFVALIGSQLPGTVDDRVRYCGLALELLGIFTVVSGLREKRLLFKRPGLLDHVCSWLARRPRWGARTQTLSASLFANAQAFGTAKLSVWQGTSPEASAEARLAALEANVETLRTEHSETSKELQEEIRKRADAVDSERLARESADRDIRTQLETFGAGSLHLETAGLFWLVLGVALATAPTEVASALAWFK